MNNYYIENPTTDYQNFFDALLNQIITFLRSVANAISSVPAVGGVLRDLFNLIAQAVEYFRLGLLNVLATISDIIDNVNNLLNANFIFELLRSVWFEIDTLRYNAVQFVKQTLYAIIPNFFILITSPSVWILNYLQSIAVWFLDFLNAPFVFILDLFSTYLPSVYSFFVSPVNTLVQFIQTFYFELEQLQRNPVLYFLNKFNQINNALYLFALSPVNFLSDFIRTVYPDLYSFSVNPVSFIISKIKYYFDNFIEFEKEWLINLIIKFLKLVF